MYIKNNIVDPNSHIVLNAIKLPKTKLLLSNFLNIIKIIIIIRQVIKKGKGK